jgi:hypothetical protein
MQRRRSLEEWLQLLLEDLEISRSAPVAVFLELEAAARNGEPVSCDHFSVGNVFCFPLLVELLIANTVAELSVVRPFLFPDHCGRSLPVISFSSFLLFLSYFFKSIVSVFKSPSL